MKFDKNTLISALTVGCIVSVVFAPVLKLDFINWDDGVYVFENPNIRTLNGIFFRWVSTAFVGGNWHPLTMLSLAVDYSIWGLDPFGYHFTNLCLHVLNSILVFLLTVTILSLINKKNKTSNPLLFSQLAGLLTALLWGLHPLRVESVAWVSERKDLLYAFFYFFALLSYLLFGINTGKKQFFLYILCLLSFLCSLLSKPMAVTFPVILFLIDFYSLHAEKNRALRVLILEKIPFIFCSILFSAITMLVQNNTIVSYASLSLPMRLINAAYGYMFYVAKFFFPINLAPYYPYPNKIDIFTAPYLIAILFMIIFLGITIWSLKKKKYLCGIIGFYLITLVPVIGVIQVASQSVADRYSYVPTVGFAFIAGTGFGYYFFKPDKKNIITKFLILSIIPMIGILSAHQIGFWKNSIVFWNHELKLFPKTAPRAYRNRGAAYAGKKDFIKAVDDFSKAFDTAVVLDLETVENFGEQKNGVFRRKTESVEYHELLNDRALSYYKLGKYQNAIYDANLSIERIPKNPKAYYTLGITFNATGDFHKAIECFSKAIEFDYHMSLAYLGRGIAYQMIGNISLAMKELRIAAESKNAMALFSLGILLYENGNRDEGLTYIVSAQQLGLKIAADYLNEKEYYSKKIDKL